MSFFESFFFTVGAFVMPLMLGSLGRILWDRWRIRRNRLHWKKRQLEGARLSLQWAAIDWFNDEPGSRTRLREAVQNFIKLQQE